MIPKNLKYTLTIAILAIGTACLATGCKKNHDKIDLSGSQAAESEVQTAPAATTAAEESASQEVTIEPAIENAANPAPGTSAGGSAAAFSLSVSTKNYQNQNISIQYPVISDSSVKADVNRHLEENALSVLKAYEVDEAKDTLTVTCKVLSATKNRITVRYEGSYMPEGGAHPSSLFFTNTVNVSSGSDIGLSYLADPATLASYVLSDDCTFPEASADTAAAAKTFLKEENAAYYTALFQNADFPFQGTFPECFSYEYEGAIYFSLPVPHALGDYILAVYTPENK